MLLIEYALLQPLERRASAWRHDPAAQRPGASAHATAISGVNRLTSA
jgi:hypothetical protein